jgi:hypothetical protein
MNKQELTSIIKEVLTECKESAQKKPILKSDILALKESIKNLIKEDIEEIKVQKEDGIFEIVEELTKEIHSKCKDSSVVYDDSKNISIDCGIPHQFSIRPQSKDVFDVVYFKDKTHRTKKLNLNLEELKKFIKEKLTSKDAGYVADQYNKSAENDKDKVEKSNLPSHHKFVKKEIKDTKNDNRDYNEMTVKENDLPDKPMATVEKTKKQIDHPIKGTKPDYTFPKQKDKKLLIKQKSKGKLKKLGNS